MASLFNLPKMGQTMSEGTILRWLKREGDHVEGWEGIVEMQTDKVDMEIEPQVTGTLRKILAAEGAVVPVGAPIAIIGAPDEDISELLKSVNGSVSLPSTPDETPAGSTSTGSGPAPIEAALPNGGAASDEFPSVSPRAREAASEAGLEWKSLSLPGTGFEGMIVERDILSFLQSGQAPAEPGPRSTPLAKKIAEEHGVPLESLAGSGPSGRIQADDVRKAASRKLIPVIEARDIPLRGMRKVIAERLSASYQQAVHVPLRVDVDMTAAGELRRQLKPELEPQGARLTYTDLIAAAAIKALVAFPAVNATLEGDTVRIHPSVNLGIAVALDEGLTVPVIPDAHALALAELSAAVQDRAKKARAGQLPPDAFTGGTFTITNLGQYGIDSFDPIINPPQVAILGVGSIRDQIVALNGAPAVRPIATLTLCFDHRALDGAPGSMFLARVKELLENPARLLL